MKFSIEEITPELAQTILTNLNKKNRNVSDRIVRSYANDMANGKWLITGDPLRFDVEGSLIDGQHRLAAVVKSGITLNFAIIRDLERDVQDVIDTGRKRSPANVLELRGVTNSSLVAAVARVGVVYEKGLLTTSLTRLPECTHQEMVEWVEKNLEGLKPVLIPGSLVYRSFGGAHSAMVYSFYLMSLIDPTKTQALIEDLVDMRTSGKGDPRSALLRRLQALAKIGRLRTSPSATMYALFRTWNAIQQGHSMTLVADSPTGKPMPVLIEKAK